MAISSADEAEVTHALRARAALFAFVHGSRAHGPARPDSDLDVAAWWGGDRAPAPWKVDLPDGVDLVVLDDAPLWLAGRVAQHGRLLFDDDPPARVRWQADTRLRYLDDLPAIRARYDTLARRLASEARRGRPGAGAAPAQPHRAGCRRAGRPGRDRGMREGRPSPGRRRGLAGVGLERRGRAAAGRSRGARSRADLDELRQFTRQVSAWLVG